MKQFILMNKNALKGFGAALLIGIVALSFQDSPIVRQHFDLQQSYDDTVPEKNWDRSMKMKEFDNIIKDLDKSMLEVNTELKKIDLSTISREVENALKEVDMQKITKDAELALQSVDLEKIMSDVRSSLKDIAWNDKNEEMEKAMQEAKQEIAAATKDLKGLDKDIIQKTLAETKKELAKARFEIGKIDMDKIMKEAKEGIDKAKEELAGIREMMNEMEKDGLIEKKAGFSIEYKDKDLYINGRKQPSNVTDKYRKYFKDDHFKINIEKE
jgi:hypothetical protein